MSGRAEPILTTGGVAASFFGRVSGRAEPILTTGGVAASFFGRVSGRAEPILTTGGKAEGQMPDLEDARQIRRPKESVFGVM